MIITILRWYFKILLRLYYKEIDITGIERIKKDTSQLFIANHQNSLVDGLLFITQLDKNVIMTTTSKLRKFPFAERILRRANVQIFYRRVDGYSDQILNKNRDSLDACADLLAENNHVLIFPEGITTTDGKMLPFKTGFARITERYLEKHEDVEIIPIYINYTDRRKIRSSVSMEILEPVHARPVKEKYPDNFVPEFISLVRSKLEEVEKRKSVEADDDIPESLNYLDRVLAFPVLLFHFIPSALTILLGDLINPREETKATTRVFLSIVIFPLIIFFQILFLISLLPILWVYFILSYVFVYSYQYAKSRISRRQTSEKNEEDLLDTEEDNSLSDDEPEDDKIEEIMT